MDITSEELELLNNSNFIFTKIKAQEKIYSLLQNTRAEINTFFHQSNFLFHQKLKISEFDKISKGEKYLNLPYMILDSPAYFSKNNIFDYRTMFLWANFFSFSLHLQGLFLDYYKHKLLNNFDNLLNKNIYISVSDSPWEYLYNKNNYVLVSKEHIDFIKTAPFIKLSKKCTLSEWRNVPKFSVDFLEFLLRILS